MMRELVTGIMPGMNVATALVIIPGLFVLIGYLPIRNRLRSWLPDQPIDSPSPPATMFLWLGTLALFGAGVALAGAEHERLLAAGFIVPMAAATWAVLLVTRSQPRNAFFWLCVAWTLIAIIAAWIYAVDPSASLLTIPLLAFLIMGGVANFFIWQRPPGGDSSD
jgi:tryptophan-rich sensory protein